MQQSDKSQSVPSILSKVNILRGDKVLWVIITVLFILSTLVVYSSVAKMGYADMGTGTNAIFTKHLFVMALAIITLFGTYMMGAKLLYKASFWVYIFCLLLTVGVYFFGKQTNSVARWYDFFGVSVQPSELLKVATILFLARLLDEAQQTISKQRLIPSLNPRTWRTAKQKNIWLHGVVKILLPIVLSAAVIVKAHNSSAMLVFGIGVVMMFIARAKKLEIAKFVGIILLFFGVYTLAGGGRGDTASSRISSFFTSWTTTAEKTPVWQLSDAQRAMIAIHDGGVFGLGAGQSVMRAKITHPESDYIFSFFVEEYGIIMGMLLVILYTWIFARAVGIFRRSRWLFGGLLAIGMSLLVTVQAMLHFMVSTHLFFETGQNLPLISHGGTSMICTAAALGIILSISRQVNDRTLLPPEGIAAMSGTDE